MYIWVALPFFIKIIMFSKSKMLDFISRYVSPTVLKNSGALIFDKVLGSLLAAIIFFLVAGYLGPSQLGHYNYALSVLTVFSTFTLLGIDSVVIRELVTKNEEREIVLGTVFFLRLLGYILTLALSIILIKIVNGSEVVLILTLILSTAYLFRLLQVIDLWFISQRVVKWGVIARIAGVFIMASLKLYIIFSGLGLYWIAVATVVEFLAAGILLVLLYKSKMGSSILQWRFSKKYLTNLLLMSWPLILGSLFVSMSSRADQFLLGSLKNEYSVGIYSPAVKISELWFYVPSAILTSVFPNLISAYKENLEIYEIKLKRVASTILYATVVFCLIIFMISPVVVNLLLGQQYSDSIEILKVYIWVSVGSVMGSFLSMTLITVGKQKYDLLLKSIPFVLGIPLSFILIPRLGGNGAALSTVIAYNMSWLIVVFFIRENSLLRKAVIGSLILPFEMIWEKIRKF